MKKIIIDENHANQRIDKYLKKLLSQAPSQMIYKMLRKKDVKVNGVKVKENYIVKTEDVVELFLYDDKFQEYTEPQRIYDLQIQFQVLYEDENILFVGKPAGLLVHGDINEDVNTLTNQVLTYLNQKGEYNPQESLGFTPAPVHRLDRNTSGIVIFGKTMKALQDLNEMMRDHECLEKTYITICKGYVSSCELKDYVLRDEKELKTKIVPADTPGAVMMHTCVESLGSQDNYSLLKVRLLTGRTHQIRVHLSSLGNPIIGDSKYGNQKTNQFFYQNFHLKHQFLHAYQIQLKEPIGSLVYLKDRVITCPLPSDLLAIKGKLFGKK